MDDAHSQSHPSEGVRILLEKIDTLTARVQTCERTIEHLELQISTQVELQAAELGEVEERLRQQIERQIAGHTAATERQQKDFISKQARLLELLASELAKVRSMAEAGTGIGRAEQPAVQPSRSPHSRRYSSEATAGDVSEFLDFGGELAGSSDLGSNAPHNRTRENREVEFWDWLESLPREPESRPAAHDINFDEFTKGRSR